MSTITVNELIEKLVLVKRLGGGDVGVYVSSHEYGSSEVESDSLVVRCVSLEETRSMDIRLDGEGNDCARIVSVFIGEVD